MERELPTTWYVCVCGGGGAHTRAFNCSLDDDSNDVDSNVDDNEDVDDDDVDDDDVDDVDDVDDDDDDFSLFNLYHVHPHPGNAMFFFLDFPSFFCLPLVLVLVAS